MKNRSSNPEPHTSDLHPPSYTITAENLGKRFNYEWIFKGLDFTFQSGNTYAITGPNGSGKSTLSQVLWGQMPPSRGNIRFHQDGKEIPVEEIFRHVAIATPYMDLIEEFTLAEQLSFHFKLKPNRWGMSIEEMMDRMYLIPARNKFISNFSSGMRQRVRLALAFYTGAPFIFLDEPGTNLDQQAFAWYLQELGTLPRHCTVFIASNQPAEYPADAQKLDIMRYK